MLGFNNGTIALQYRIENGSWVDITSVTNIIPETANYINIQWTKATGQKEENIVYYLYLRQNGGPWVNVYSGNEITYQQNIGPGNQDSYYDYFVRAKTKTEQAEITSIRFKKNMFTPAKVTSPTKVEYGTKSITIEYTGASNSNTSSVFTYNIKCNEIPLYNGETIEQQKSIAIWREGEKPTTAYFNFNDIRDSLVESSYKGNIVIILETTNKYETIKQTKFYIPTNIQTFPAAATNAKIDLENSTSYLNLLGAGFIIPDKERYNLVSWEAGFGKLGEQISYEIYASYDNGETSSKIAEVDSSALTYSHTINKLTDTAQIKYTVRTKSSYGLYSDLETLVYTMHYIDEPVISIEDTLRTSTDFTFYAQVKTNTSIAQEELSILTTGSWSCVNKEDSAIVSSGNLTETQYRQKIIVTGLVDAAQYTVNIIYNDNTGLFADSTYSVDIGSNLPVAFINKYGLGIGGIKATKEIPFYVAGNVKATNLELENAFSAIDLLVEDSPVYHTKRKPTPLEIGALGNLGSQVLDLDGNSEVECFIIKGSVKELKIWTGNGGAALETPEGTPLYLGSGSHEDIAIKEDVISLGKTLKFPAKADWRSLDISRANGDLEGTARYGIGANGDSYSPTIEYHRFADSTDSLRSRLDLMSTSLRLSSHGADETCWLGFYTGYATDVNNRIGWVGYGVDDSSRDLAISSSNNFRVYAANNNRLWTFKPIGNSNYGIVSGGTMIKTIGTSAEIQCRNAQDSAYGKILASSCVSISAAKYQTRTKTFVDYNSILMNNDVVTYLLTDEVQSIGSKADTKIGFVLEDLTPQGLSILNPIGTEGVDLYCMSSILWKVVQEQQTRIDELEKIIFKNS